MLKGVADLDRRGTRSALKDGRFQFEATRTEISRGGFERVCEPVIRVTESVVGTRAAEKSEYHAFIKAFMDDRETMMGNLDGP